MWALVDGLAGDMVGGMLARWPAKVTPVLDRWSTDPDFWIRRLSLLAELQRLCACADLAPMAAYRETRPAATQGGPDSRGRLRCHDRLCGYATVRLCCTSRPDAMG
ncbi:MAG TPA: DNA alkylation repair protein [Candidatus Saccharimonadales bacterium]|nr:DNA alkylation repair protein [Candidatus Saccharimonadales bacterium]